MSRTVVLHPGALGDVLLAVPALRALRAAAPAGELVLAAQPRIGALLAALGIVDRVVAFEGVGLEALFADDDTPERLRALLDGARVVSWFGAGDPVFVRRLGALAPGAVISSTRPPPETTVWRHLLASTGTVRTPDACRPMPVPPGLVAEGRRVLSTAGWAARRRLVMIHPGAGGVAKRWSPEGFAAVAETLTTAGVDVAMHDGPADHAAVAAVRAHLTIPALVLTDVALPALAGVLAHVALWVGCDSGVSHLAAAVGAQTVALFTETNLAWRPWAGHARTPVISPGPLRRWDVDGVLAAATGALGTGSSVGAAGR